MQVKWGTNFSSHFTVTNRVRQGGILSPYLFVVYLDELSNQLGAARVVFTMGNMVVNHLCLLLIYVCLALAFLHSTVFCLFVVILLLNKMSLLIASKQLV